MKKLVKAVLIIALLSFSSSVQGEDDLQDVSKNTDKLWRTGAGAHDGSYTAISAAMFASGILLAVGIAVLAAVLHQSTPNNNVHCH